jgi:hypothetical protein
LQEIRVGFFTDEEIDSLCIENMILHVVGGQTFTANPARKVQHEEFFIGKIIDTAVDPVFSFDVHSSTRSKLEEIASGKNTFERGAQALASSFNSKHVSSSSDGALFIFEMSVKDSSVRIYSLIKYDYREALQQDPKQPDGVLLRIINAFIDDNRAVQKTALIRVVNGAAEDEVSARDRVKRAAPELSDYFQEFLGVSREVDDAELSAKALDVLQATLQKFKADLPKQDVSAALASARGILGKASKVNNQAIIDAVIEGAGHPADAALVQRITDETQRRIRKAKLENLTFKPVRQVLRQAPTRRLRTTEGVIVIFPDDAAGSTVQIVDNGAAGQRIIIDTKQITDDDLVAKRAG